MNWRDFQRVRWLAGFSVVSLAAGIAPPLLAGDTQWLGIDGLPQVSAGVDVDGSTERTSISGGNSTYDHLSVTPLVGLRSTGFIYHPNLLTFDLSGDLGYGWDSMSYDGSGISQTVNEKTDLLRYLAQFELLPVKPYNATIFATQDHTFRDYGSFNTYTVDTTRYGSRLNWNVAGLTMNADLGYRHESDTGLNDSLDISELYFNFLGIYKRKFGQTSLAVHANDVENALSYGGSLDTKTWSVGVSDSETFGARHQISASTGFSYSQSEYSGQQVDTINATENMLVHHRRNLDSYYVVNFNRSELRPITDSSRIQGNAGLRHQLYESLTSSLEGHGTYQQDTAAAGNSTFDMYGAGLSENYAKRLQSWGHLNLGAGIVADHQDQNSPVGLLTTFDEPHTLYSPASPKYLQPVYLSQPRVVASSIQVSVAGDTLVYGSDKDFTVVQSGDLTEIKLVSPASTHVQTLLQAGDSLSVTVTYQSQSLGSSSYDTLNATAQLRLDFRNGLGLYARMNWLDNNAPAEVLAQKLTDLGGRRGLQAQMVPHRGRIRKL